ncbi:MAG: D-alanyl-D-alanine carboxypeptidase [Candidatus Levybacteria bacterium]|nr:D-alanyl-D-alanine carboxypeptidase [Candidatus Levybacteria bacterium]
MKITFSGKTIIGLLLILNILILSLVVFLLLEIKKNEVLNLAADMAPLALPLLAEDIKKIDVSSRAYIIYDPQTRTVISGKNEKLRFSPASGTKIMTAIIALEEYNLEDVLTAVGLENVDGSTMKLKEGEAITVENLLYGLMLPSGNDAAYVLTSVYQGGESGFVARMNRKAKELNLVNTKFVDPSGYSDDNYITAYDLARLASYALKNPKFAAIVSTKNKTVTDVTGEIIHELSNLNELLGVAGVNGVKTGFTEEALGVLVSSVEHEGKAYIIVVLGSDDRFLDTKNIIERAVEKITLISY